jgi:hypothetical protein
VTRTAPIVLGSVLLGGGALVHAGLTWPVAATLALFGGGALIAFAAEAVVIRLGWLNHRVGPQLVGVPLYVLPGWTGATYVSVRLALLVTNGVGAVVLAASIATVYDMLNDHQGVERGYWAYTDDLPGPRYRGVPWWNYAGWFVISGLSAALGLAFL